MMATFSFDQDIIEIHPEQLAVLKQAADNAPLRRARLCLHHGHANAVQEMVIAFCRDSYGLAPLPSDYFPRFNSRSYSAMDPSTKQWLCEYFRPHNRGLYELLGVDLGWEGDSSTTNPKKAEGVVRDRGQGSTAVPVRMPSLRNSLFWQRNTLDPSGIESEGKHGYYADLEKLGIHAPSEPRVLSLLVLLEDGRPLAACPRVARGDS